MRDVVTSSEHDPSLKGSEKMTMDENHRILIVDDDAAVREAYREILAPTERNYLSDGDRLFGGGEAKNRSLPYGIWEAKNGDEAVTLVREATDRGKPFALAFVDMKMPGMNGAETAREIWRIDPGIKIVIVTAYSDVTPDEIVQVTAREDLFYLRKPFNPQEIRQFARALCRQRNLEQERDVLSLGLRNANLALEDMNRNLEEKVRQRTYMLQARNEILQMMINDLDFGKIAERICREIAEEFRIECLFVEVPFMDKIFSNQSRLHLSGDLIRLSRVSQGTCTRVKEEYGCAIPLMRDGAVLGVCLSDNPVLLSDKIKGWLSLLTLDLMQARSIKESPELVDTIDRLIAGFSDGPKI